MEEDIITAAMLSLALSWATRKISAWTDVIRDKSVDLLSVVKPVREAGILVSSFNFDEQTQS